MIGYRIVQYFRVSSLDSLRFTSESDVTRVERRVCLPTCTSVRLRLPLSAFSRRAPASFVAYIYISHVSQVSRHTHILAVYKTQAQTLSRKRAQRAPDDTRPQAQHSTHNRREHGDTSTFGSHIRATSRSKCPWSTLVNVYMHKPFRHSALLPLSRVRAFAPSLRCKPTATTVTRPA